MATRVERMRRKKANERDGEVWVEGGQSSVAHSDRCPPLSRTVVRTAFGRVSGWNVGKGGLSFDDFG